MQIEAERERVEALQKRPFAIAGAAVRITVLTGLFTLAALYESVHLRSLIDTDIWWHLRTGHWILQNHSVPHNGLFSQYSDRPWIATSWGFDVLAAQASNYFGLKGIPVLLIFFKVIIAVLTFVLARGSLDWPWSAALLAAVAQYAIPELPPGPVLLSVMFFAIQLILLFQARRLGSVRPLYWLPLLFLLWANFHLQFLNGLVVLLLFWAATVIEKVLGRIVGWEIAVNSLPIAKVTGITAASLFATLANPYSYHPYGIPLKYLSSKFLLAFNPELHSIRFRRPEDYVLLLLTMAAFFALGRRRSRDLFKITLMIFCMCTAFRIARDSWFLVLPSIAILGDAIDSQRKGLNSRHRWRPEKLITAGVTTLLILFAVRLIPSEQEVLLNKVAATFPVRACDYIQQHHLAPPLFNEYRWGGFLVWYLPRYPVAIDDRQDLYGAEITERYANVVQALAPLEADPTFVRASTILLDKNSGMANGLPRYPGFEPVYTDDLARILIKKR